MRVDSASSHLFGTLNVGSGQLSIDLDAVSHLAQVNLRGTGALNLTGTARDLNIGVGIDLPHDVGGDTVGLLNNTDGAIRLQTDLGLFEHDASRRSVVLIGGASDLTLAGSIYGEASLTKVGSGNLTIESNTSGWDNANSGARIGVRDGTLTTGLGLLNNRTLVFEGANSQLTITDPDYATYHIRSLIGADADAHLNLGNRDVTFYQNTSGEYLGAISTTGTLTMDVDLSNLLPTVRDRQTLGTVNAATFNVNYGDVTITNALHADSITVYGALTTTFDFTNASYITLYGPQSSWTAHGAFTNRGNISIDYLSNLTATSAINNHDTFYVFDSTVTATAFNQYAGSLNAPLYVNGGVLEIGSSSSTGTLTVRGGVTLASGSVTRWEFEPIDGTANAASTDLLEITNSPGQTDGQLTFAPATAQLPLMIQVGSSSFPYDADFTTSHSWTFATTTDGVVGFDSSTLLVRPQPGFNLANAVNGQGNFGVQVVGHDVNIVYDSSTFINVSSGTSTLSTPISESGTYGFGGLTKIGSGTLSLTAANTYTGYTQMLGGTMEIGHDAALSSNAVIWNNGTIRADSTARTLANTFYLQGNLTVAGASDLTFTGSMTNVGDSNRTITISNTGLTTFGDIVITGSPTSNQLTRSLTINGAGTALVNGVISDGLFADGRLIRNTGNGTLILAGANTYTGGTVINAGTIQLGNGGTSGSILGDVTVGTNGTLAFNRSDILAFNGQITGAGHVSQLGTGTTVLDGTHAYSGTTSVQKGTLIVNGSIADSSLTAISQGATLGGSGAIGNLELAGILAPGNSPGTLNAGNTLWLGGASYNWEINNAYGTPGTTWDLLNITGTLTIAATAHDPCIIKLISLLGDNSAGALINFDAALDYSYIIATASEGISGFNADTFAISTSGFANDLLGGNWSVSLQGNSLSLDFNAFSAVPEPSSYAAIFGALAIGFAAWRKRRSAR